MTLSHGRFFLRAFQLVEAERTRDVQMDVLADKYLRGNNRPHINSSAAQLSAVQLSAKKMAKPLASTRKVQYADLRCGRKTLAVDLKKQQEQETKDRKRKFELKVELEVQEHIIRRAKELGMKLDLLVAVLPSRRAASVAFNSLVAFPRRPPIRYDTMR